MFTPDERVRTMKEIQEVYQVLDLYEGMKEDEKDEKEIAKFAETTFSLTAYAIATLAETFGFDSKVKDELEQKSKENKERNQHIQELKHQLASNLHPETFQENVRAAFKVIETTWKEQGFTGTYEKSIRQNGMVNLSFDLQPVHEMWDLWMEATDEEKLEKIFQTRQQTFNEKGFAVINEDSYVYILDNDENKQKIQSLLQTLFPTLEIWKWHTQKNRHQFILSKAEVTIKSLQFMEGK